MAKCAANGNPIAPASFAAGAQWAYKFFTQSCTYVAPGNDTGSTKHGRIVFGSTYKRFFMVFQNRQAAYKPARLLIAVSKSEDPRDGWWTYVDEVGGNNNSLDVHFLGVNSSILVVSNKMKLMDGHNKMVQQWMDHTMYGVAELAKGSTSYVKKIWPPYNQNSVCGGCAEQPPFGPYSPSNPPAYKSESAPEFKAAACVHESATTDFFCTTSPAGLPAHFWPMLATATSLLFRTTQVGLGDQDARHEHAGCDPAVGDGAIHDDARDQPTGHH
jgi:hypothetical protein